MTAIISRTSVEAAERANRIEAHRKRIEENYAKGVVKRQAKALAELERNGIDVADLKADLKPDAPALNAERITGEADFQSAPSAKAMKKTDRANVVVLSAQQCDRLLDLLASVARSKKPRRRADRADWPEDDVRWTLTPHQLQKLSRSKREAKHLKAVG